MDADLESMIIVNQVLAEQLWIITVRISRTPSPAVCTLYIYAFMYKYNDNIVYLSDT